MSHGISCNTPIPARRGAETCEQRSAKRPERRLFDKDAGSYLLSDRLTIGFSGKPDLRDHPTVLTSFRQYKRERHCVVRLGGDSPKELATCRETLT